MNCKSTILIILLTFLPFTLSGCWSSKQITDIALISAIGIDLNDEGKYVGTYQFYNPQNITSSLQGGGDQTSPISTYSAVGSTLLEIEGVMTKKIPRELYYAHANLLVIGEKLAREEGLTKILDALDRGTQFRSSSKIIIARETTANDILSILTSIDQIPSEKIIKTLTNSQNFLGESIDIDLSQAIDSLITVGKEPFITGFQVDGKSKEGKMQDSIQQTEPKAVLKANGIAVFKEGKLVDWLDGNDAKGALWVLNKITNTGIDSSWKNIKNAFTFQVTDSKTKIDVTDNNGKPYITIKVRVTGDIDELRTPIAITDSSTLNKMELQISKAIENNIKSSITKAQQAKADVLGIGAEIHRKNPILWKEVSNNWEDKFFTKFQFNIKVETLIHNTGIRNKSYLSDIKGK